MEYLMENFLFPDTINFLMLQNVSLNLLGLEIIKLTWEIKKLKSKESSLSELFRLRSRRSAVWEQAFTVCSAQNLKIHNGINKGGKEFDSLLF